MAGNEIRHSASAELQQSDK
jgi:hypothetical protein